MNPNDNKNNKNNKPGGNWRGVASLVGWALLLTIIFSYASSVIGSTGRQASSINVEYGEFQEMVESGQVARVEFDNAEDILLITPEEGYSYTAEDGTVYTKTEDGYTYMDAAGQEQTAHLELFTVRIQSNDAVIDFLNEYGVEGVDKEYQAPVNPVLAMLVSYVLPFVLIFLMFSLVMRWMAKKGGMGGMGGIGGVGKANAKVYMEKSTGVTFKDVAGQDEAKESLTEIIDFLHNPQKYTEIGAKLPKGALLVGPPGPRACCWWALLEPVKLCWQEPLPVKPVCRFSPSPALTLWRCSWAWAPAASGTSLRRRPRWPPASCSSTRSTPSANPGTTAWAATTSGSRH